MTAWKLLFTKRAAEDAIKLAQIGLKSKAQKLLETIAQNPYQIPPPFEKLVNVKDTYSRRIDIRHRLVYEVRKDERLIIIKMMYKYYGR